MRDIGRYCPDYIVKSAREKKSTFKTPKNNESSNLFIQLDNEIKIDIEDDHIKEFSETILKFVKTIADIICKLSGLLFKVNPAGSFPMGNKIGQIDEFDFVLEWIDMPKDLTNLSLQEISSLYFERGPVKRPYKEMIHIREIHYPDMIIRQIFLECQDVDNITIKTLIQKRFAMNLIISWGCLNCHNKHEISLDLAVSLKSKDTAYQKFSEITEISFKDTAFEQTIESDEFTYHCFPFVREGELFDPFFQCRVDTNYFDMWMFHKCDKISPNIKLVFRITKFIFSKAFPRQCHYHKCVLHRTDVCDFEPVISSYVLKQLLFREVLEFPSSKDWSAAQIELRVASLLKKIHKVREIQDLLNPCEVKDIFGEKYNFLFEYFDTWMIKLISWFQDGFTETSADLSAFKEEKNGSKQLWFLKNVWIITAKEPRITWPEYKFSSPLLKLEIPETRSDTSKTKKIIYGICLKVMSDMNYVDLTTLSDLYFVLFAVFYSNDLGVLIEDDVKSNNVIEKLNLIREFTETFEVTFETVWLTLREMSNLPSYNDKFIRINSIISQVTIKEAVSIYKYFEQEAFRNKTQVYHVDESNVDSALPGAVFRNDPSLLQRPSDTDSDEKEISLLKKVRDQLASCSTFDKAPLWLYCAIMKYLGKLL